ncbi:MAG: hypothetical protein IT378_27120, partial [Sandaracinaceae bacterium]|nr:hypothetical protein [Sandaracinaceae bacterium]
IRAVLAELGLVEPLPSSMPPSSVPPSSAPPEPWFPSEFQPDVPPRNVPYQDPAKDPTTMLLTRPDFAWAHARVRASRDEIALERASGFEPTARYATRAPEGGCHDDDELKPEETQPLPKNSKLVRLRLPANHQIDPKEVMAVATPADRETAYRYALSAFSVDDRTIDVLVQLRDPDVDQAAPPVRFNLLLVRVA